ncbi:MAG: transcriptional antiterminator, Rof, partial [Candidatus Competibacterales bacterium]
MMDDAYIPIDCELYARFELAVLRGERLRIAWRDGWGGLHVMGLLPLDLCIRHRAEHLLARAEGGGCLELRLDRLVR